MTVVDRLLRGIIVVYYSNYLLNKKLGSSDSLALWQGLTGAGMSLFSVLFVGIFLALKFFGLLNLVEIGIISSMMISFVAILIVAMFGQPFEKIIIMEKNGDKMRVAVIVVEILSILSLPVLAAWL